MNQLLRKKDDASSGVIFLFYFLKEAIIVFINELHTLIKNENEAVIIYSEVNRRYFTEFPSSSHLSAPKAWSRAGTTPSLSMP